MITVFVQETAATEPDTAADDSGQTQNENALLPSKEDEDGARK